MFLFIGPTKSGTTWIDGYLRKRGDVSLPVKTKETFFFDKVYSNGFDWYLEQFKPAPYSVRVEVAPSLFHKPVAAERVAKHLPDAQVICTVRNPFDRAVSHYFHYRKAGYPRTEIKTMLQDKPSLYEAGLYGKHAAMWETLLGRERVHYLFFDNLRDNPDRFCRDLCAILNIEHPWLSSEIDDEIVNKATIPRSPLLARIGRSSSDWLRRHGAHSVVNPLKKTPLKRMLFAGGGDISEERDEVATQIRAHPEIFAPGYQDFVNRVQAGDVQEAVQSN